MKEKNKKIFKALGVGAVATLGLFTMAGCSLSDTEKADVMEGLENANTYMEETIDLLKEQNKQLNEQNNKLEDYINEIQQENAKITSEEAYNKLMMAKAKFETNYQGIRDNFRIIQTYDEYPDDISIIEYYKTNDNGYVSIDHSEYVENGGPNGEIKYVRDKLIYENDGKTYQYTKRKENENSSYSKVMIIDDEMSETLSGVDYIMSRLCFELLSEKNIKSIEILENGNSKITVIAEDEREDDNEVNKDIYYIEYELTSDNKIVSVSINLLEVNSIISDGDQIVYEIDGSSGCIKLEYGAITEERVNEFLQEAINKELKAED